MPDYKKAGVMSFGLWLGFAGYSRKLSMSCLAGVSVLHWLVLFVYSGILQGCLPRELDVLGKGCSGSEELLIGNILVIHCGHQKVGGRSLSGSWFS